MLKAVFVLCLILNLTACDKASSNQSSDKAPDTLAQYAASGSGKPAAGAKKSEPAPTPKPVEQSGQPAPQAPAQAKIYTFQGNALLPPNAYMDNPNGKIDDISVCGVAALTPASVPANAQQYCYKFSELSNRLYDKDHSGLDVWDVQGNYYLLLTKTEKDQTPHELWVERTQFGVYHPYADITQQKLLFLGDWDYKTKPEWPLQAYNGPDGTVIELKKENYPTMKSSSPMVMIVAVAQSAKKELWFQLNIINSLCESRGSKDETVSPVIMNVWYPAYRLQNNLRIPTVWFDAKGC